jgi:hypothetical protein
MEREAGDAPRVNFGGATVRLICVIANSVPQTVGVLQVPWTVTVALPIAAELLVFKVSTLLP